MYATHRRPLLLLAVLALFVAGCAASAVPPATATPSDTPTPSASPRPSTTPRTLPPTGNTGSDYPELAVSLDGPGYVIELVDPTAKAWRIVIGGTGALATDRLEFLIDVGDIAPGVQVSSVIDGKTVEIDELGGIISTPTSAAGGCHPTLQLCYSSGGIAILLQAGTVGLVLERLEAGAFTITGATAGWPAEPFVLGPWRETDPLTTGA